MANGWVWSDASAISADPKVATLGTSLVPRGEPAHRSVKWRVYWESNANSSDTWDLACSHDGVIAHGR